MITCETCGELLPDGTQFCSRCGAHVGNPAPTEPIEVPMDTPYPETPPAPDTNPYMQSNDTAYSQQQAYQQPAYQQPTPPPQPPYQDPYAQSAGQQAYGQYGQQPYYPQPQPNKTDGKAVVSLILGILSISTSCSYGFGLIFGIPGLLLAMLSRKSTQQQPYGTPNSGNSAGLATAGMICSIIGTVLSAIMLIILIILFALGMASEVLE